MRHVTSTGCSLLTGLAILLGVAGASAGQRTAERPPESGPEAELILINIAIEAAVLHHDIGYLDMIAASDFRFTHGNASSSDGGPPLVDTKATWLAAAENARTPFLERKVGAQQVELHDDVAVTSGSIQVRSASADQSLQDYTIWFVRVFARREGAWQLLSHRTVRTSRAER